MNCLVVGAGLWLSLRLSVCVKASAVNRVVSFAPELVCTGCHGKWLFVNVHFVAAFTRSVSCEAYRFESLIVPLFSCAIFYAWL